MSTWTVNQVRGYHVLQAVSNYASIQTRDSAVVPVPVALAYSCLCFLLQRNLLTWNHIRLHLKSRERCCGHGVWLAWSPFSVVVISRGDEPRTDQDDNVC